MQGCGKDRTLVATHAAQRAMLICDIIAKLQHGGGGGRAGRGVLTGIDGASSRPVRRADRRVTHNDCHYHAHVLRECIGQQVHTVRERDVRKASEGGCAWRKLCAPISVLSS